MKKPETLCFHCDLFSCAWRQKNQPVDGWKAVPTRIRKASSFPNSYIVFSCPMFQRQRGYANDKEWDRMQKRPSRTVYHALADIHSLCLFMDPGIYGRIREEILEVQALHEKDIETLEMLISNLRAELSSIGGEEVPDEG